MYGNPGQAKKDGNSGFVIFFVLISAFSAVSIRLFLLSLFIKRRFVLIFSRSILFRRIEGVVRSGGVLALKFAAVLLMLKRV